MDGVVHDLRHALRALRRSMGFAAVTVVTLGLGIGVVTALYAVVKAVLLHPIATDQQRVVRIWEHDRARGRGFMSYHRFETLRDQSRTLQGLAALQYAGASTLPMEVNGEPTAIDITPVSWQFFEVLHGGVPQHGRWLTASDEDRGAELVGVISDRFFRRAAAGNPAIVGERLRPSGEGRPVLIVGVAPPELDYPLGTDVWVAIPALFDGAAGRFDARDRTFNHFDLIGRLEPGVSIDEARAELSLIRQRLVSEFPNDYRPADIVAEPILDTLVGNTRQVLWFLSAAAGLVFGIAGVNIASLLLMRLVARRPEIAVRLSLGADFRRVLRETMTETTLLGLLGCATGVLFALGLLAALRIVAPADVPRLEHAALDGRVALFAFIAALLWVSAFGTAPLWMLRGIRCGTNLRSSDEALRGVRATQGLRIFTVAQIAAAVIVAVGAGLLARSFLHLQRIDRGFDARNLVVVSLLLPAATNPGPTSALPIFETLLPHIDALPDVVSSSPVHMLPGSGVVGLSAPMIFAPQTREEAAHNPVATWEPVLPSYFETMGIPIVAGRAFTAADRKDTMPVAVISESVAARYWPGRNPVGQRLRFTSRSPETTVVGVAGESRYRELTGTWMTVYFPASQFFFFRPGSLVVKTAVSPERVMPLIRQALRTHAPRAAIASMNTMDSLLARELSRPRTAVTVTVIFALAAIVLAAIGVYGVMSYETRQRRRELAVRSALGASPADIFQSVIRRSGVLGAVGAAAGLLLAAAASRSLQSLLYELDAIDPVTYGAGALVLVAIVTLVSCVPARRAASTDPAVVLRTE